MKYNYILQEWAGKDDLKRIYGLKDSSKKRWWSSFVNYISRIRQEIFSVADLSKLIVDRKAESVVIHGQKLEYLCRTLTKQYHVYMISVNGIGLKEYCLNNRFSMLCNLGAYTEDAVLAFISENDKRLEKIKKKLKKYLLNARPKILLTTSFRPSHIFDIILYEAARECNIPVVFLEHGFLAAPLIYEYAWRKHTVLAPEWFDFYWFWNAKNRAIYTKVQQTEQERSFVLGYPLKPFMQKNRNRNMSILFVGDRLIFDEESEWEKYYNMVNDIYSICSRTGIAFKFKDHSPEKEAEHMKKYLLPEIERTNDFYGELRKNYITIGVRTSALVEAGAIGNYVIQIMYDPEYVKNFVWAHSYLIEDYQSELEPLIHSIIKGEIKPKTLAPDEFYQPDDLVERFNEGLEQIERYKSGTVAQYQ